MGACIGYYEDIWLCMDEVEYYMEVLYVVRRDNYIDEMSIFISNYQ